MLIRRWVMSNRLKDMPKRHKGTRLTTAPCHFCGEEVAFVEKMSKKLLLLGANAVCENCGYLVLQK